MHANCSDEGIVLPGLQFWTILYQINSFIAFFEAMFTVLEYFMPVYDFHRFFQSNVYRS